MIADYKLVPFIVFRTISRSELNHSTGVVNMIMEPACQLRNTYVNAKKSVSKHPYIDTHHGPTVTPKRRGHKNL